jgi:hypothetical protein
MSPTISIGSRKPVEAFAGRTSARIGTMRIPIPGMPVFVMPMRTAAPATTAHWIHVNDRSIWKG